MQTFALYINKLPDVLSHYILVKLSLVATFKVQYILMKGVFLVLRLLSPEFIKKSQLSSKKSSIIVKATDKTYFLICVKTMSVNLSVIVCPSKFMLGEEKKGH